MYARQFGRFGHLFDFTIIDQKTSEGNDDNRALVVIDGMGELIYILNIKPVLSTQNSLEANGIFHEEVTSETAKLCIALSCLTLTWEYIKVSD